MTQREREAFEAMREALRSVVADAETSEVLNQGRRQHTLQISGMAFGQSRAALALCEHNSGPCEKEHEAFEAMREALNHMLADHDPCEHNSGPCEDARAALALADKVTDA